MGKKNHKWDERDIYKYLKHHVRYLRRKKRKAEHLANNKNIEEEELNDIENDITIEENRDSFLVHTIGREETLETQVPEMEPLQSIEDDECFLLVVLSLPTIDVMKKHLKKVMEDVNARVTPKPFGVGYRKWDKEKQVREVAKYYRKQCLGKLCFHFLILNTTSFFVLFL